MNKRWVWAGVIGILVLAALSSQGTPAATSTPVATATPTTAAPATTSPPTAAPTSPPTAGPTEPPSVAFMLARVNAEDRDNPDRDTDPAAAEQEFQRVLTCILAADPSQTEQKAGDTLYASWAASAKRETLLEWARALC